MSRLSRFARICVLAPALALSSCASKDAVSVSGGIGNVEMTIAQGSLVTTVEGKFDVYLELGARASEGTDVTFSDFSLVRASDGTAVLAKERLSVVAPSTAPVHLAPGDNTTIQFRIGDLRSDGTTVPSEIDQGDYDKVCGAGQVIIVGTMHDSAHGATSTPLSSPAFTPSGC